MNILKEAENAVYGDRQADYGSVTENFANIAKGWETILKTKVTPEQVGLCMVWVKVCRQLHKPKRDNLVDGAGYFATIGKMEEEKAKVVDMKLPIPGLRAHREARVKELEYGISFFTKDNLEPPSEWVNELSSLKSFLQEHK